MTRFCRNTAMAAAAAAVIGAGAPALAQSAQSAQAPAQSPAQAPAAATDQAPPARGWGPGIGRGMGPGMMGPGMMGPGMMGPGMGMPHWGQHMRGERGQMAGPMGPRGPLSGLVMPREDKQLTADEAVKIAEGFLLWMGERDWKIANAVQQDSVVRFDLTTKDGSRIATFTMDRKTGRVQRVG